MPMIIALAGFYAGVAYADFMVTWKQRRHISIDAVFMSGLSIICAGAAFIIPRLT